jgi:hypothetical protein
LVAGRFRVTLFVMDDSVRKKLVPGARVRVTQQIAARHYSLPAVVEGTILEFGQRETGSWYAHSRDDKLWLDRLVLKKDDGEITTLNLDDYSHVEVEGSGARGQGPEPAASSSVP